MRISSKNTEQTRRLFLVPVCNKRGKNKSLKSALDSGKLNDGCKKMRPHMPKMAGLINWNST